MAGLTTHVLDTMHGVPAEGVAVRLYNHDQGHLIAEAVTNADGRCDAPLIAPADMRPGRFRLEFSVAAYFASKGLTAGGPAFLDVVTVDFGIDDPQRHYHVPLLVSPFGYTTYRGS